MHSFTVSYFVRPNRARQLFYVISTSWYTQSLHLYFLLGTFYPHSARVRSGTRCRPGVFTSCLVQTNLAHCQASGSSSVRELTFGPNESCRQSSPRCCEFLQELHPPQVDAFTSLASSIPLQFNWKAQQGSSLGELESPIMHLKTGVPRDTTVNCYVHVLSEVPPQSLWRNS